MNIKCAYCGTKQEQAYFCIGASKKPAWVMNEGTGKVSCPKCFDEARRESRDAMDRHIEAFNKRASFRSKT